MKQRVRIYLWLAFLGLCFIGMTIKASLAVQDFHLNKLHYKGRGIKNF